MVPDNPNVEEDPSLMAIFFAHQDIPSEVDGSGVYFRIVEVDKEEDQQLKDRIISDFSTAMAASIGWEPKYTLIITWKNMTYANRRREKDLKVFNPFNEYKFLMK